MWVSYLTAVKRHAGGAATATCAAAAKSVSRMVDLANILKVGETIEELVLFLIPKSE